MATCRSCGADVPGRRWKCDDCKAGKPAAAVEETRGQLLESALAPAGSPRSVQVLAEEAGRITDRLDELDRIIAGKGVLDLMRFRTKVFEDLDHVEVNVNVVFDSVLGEARQQAGQLRQILDSLTKGSTTKRAAAASSNDDAAGSGGGTVLSEFERRRQQRTAGKGRA